MKKVILLLMVAILSANLRAADDFGDALKLTKSQEYAMKKPATRAFGSGSSIRENIATQKATDEARSALAQSLEQAIIRTAEKYGFEELAYIETDDDGASYTEGGERSKYTLKTICQQVLKGIPVVKMDRFYKKKNKKYTIFVCVEFQGSTEEMAEETVKQLKSRLSDKDKARINSKLDQIQKELEKELENQPVENPIEIEDEEEES